jgi:hypothetical protein
MVKEDQGPKQGSPENRKRIAGRIIAPLVLSFLGLVLYGIGCGPNPGGGPGDKIPSRLFHDWPQNRKPLFVLLLSGQQHGYLQPCGCSPIQYGGLERRYNVIQQLKKEKGWPIVAVDLGDIAQERGPQKLLKYVTSMESLKKLDYTAVGMGKTEGLLPFIDGLANFALNNQENNQTLPPHVLVGNLQEREKNFPGAEALAFGGGSAGIPKIGVTSVVAPSVSKEIKDPGVNFDAPAMALPGLLAQLQKRRADFTVLLLQGSDNEAKQIAANHGGFQVIQHLSAEEEPPENPTWVNSSMLVTVGHKGRYVGLVGVYPSNKPGMPFDLYYQLLRIGPEYKTLPGKDADNPILEELEKYARKVRDDNYLQMYSQTKHPIQLAFPNSKYVGSQACQKCHPFAFQVWQNSKHAQAFQTLVNAKRPSLRQFDGECVQCHVIGFEYNTGYRNQKDTPQLKDVGCESCHGPGSEHVQLKRKTPPALFKLMNPYKTPPNETEEEKGIRLRQLNFFCQHCHDVDNDVNWNNPRAEAGQPPHRWAPISHMTPKE